MKENMFHVFTLISVNVPPEILSWSMDKRQQFVESMRKGCIPEYSGRGIMIGSAGAGKIRCRKDKILGRSQQKE